jgi:hypothetical protein
MHPRCRLGRLPGGRSLTRDRRVGVPVRDLGFPCLLPNWPSHRVLELAPAYWRETFEKRETQEALDANVLRRVVLGLPVGASHRPSELPRQRAVV